MRPSNVSNLSLCLHLASLNGRVLASAAGAGAELLGLLAGDGTLELGADLLDGGGAGARDGGLVALVGVDASQELAVVSLDVLDNNIAGAHLLAVTASAVKLAEVDGSEAVDGDGTETVVLDDLVLGAGSTATADKSVAVTLDGEGILADLLPPDVLDGARALAVNTLDLVGADDDVLEGSTVLKDEDGILVTTLLLASALHTSAVGLHATVEGALDDLGGLVGDGALGGGDGEGGALLKGTHGVGGDVALGSGNGGGGKEPGNDHRELHFGGGRLGVWVVGEKD